jgi:hypothetical protein
MSPVCPSTHLLREQLVGGRCRHQAALRRIGGQRNRGQARPLALEAADERHGEVVRGRRGQAVAARDDLVAVRQRGEHRVDRRCDRQRQRVGGFGMKRGAVAEMLLNTFD